MLGKFCNNHVVIETDDFNVAVDDPAKTTKEAAVPPGE